MRHVDILLASHDGPVPEAELAAARARDARGEPLHAVPAAAPSPLARLDDATLGRQRDEALRFSAGLFASAKAHLREARIAAIRAGQTQSPGWWRDQRRCHRQRAAADLELRRCYRDAAATLDAERARRARLVPAAA